jgi:hypothetical protein
MFICMLAVLAGALARDIPQSGREIKSDRVQAVGAYVPPLALQAE